MSALFAISLTTGILSGVWGWVSVSLGLLTWAGFLGSTTYFASTREGLPGLVESIFTNTSGVFWAMVIIKLSTVVNIDVAGYIITAVIAFFMCIQAKASWLSFIPGTFIGCCATFASGGNWELVLPSLFVGSVFGFLMKASGLWLYARLHKDNQQMSESGKVA